MSRTGLLFYLIPPLSSLLSSWLRLLVMLPNSRFYWGSNNLFITLGQGINYGIANECMNKIKEMSIANSEAYYTLEYRHGPMSLVDQHTLLILLANDATTEMDRKLMAQMKQFGGVSLAIGTDAAIRFPECDYILDVESSLSSLQLAAVIGFIGQFLGYAIAQFKNIDADTPRHVAQAIVLEK